MELDELAKRVAIALMDKSYTMATVEECTSGLLGACIASQDYAQRWYKGSIVTYTEDVAAKLLEVPQYTIERNDFVSSQVAQQMALTALYKFNVNICACVIGYVEGSGSTNVAAGEVQICVAKLDKQNNISFKYKKVRVSGNNRAKNIEIALEEALHSTLEHIIGEE